MKQEKPELTVYLGDIIKFDGERYGRVWQIIKDEINGRVILQLPATDGDNPDTCMTLASEEVIIDEHGKMAKIRNAVRTRPPKGINWSYQGY